MPTATPLRPTGSTAGRAGDTPPSLAITRMRPDRRTGDASGIWRSSPASRYVASSSSRRRYGRAVARSRVSRREGSVGRRPSSRDSGTSRSSSPGPAGRSSTRQRSSRGDPAARHRARSRGPTSTEASHTARQRPEPSGRAHCSDVRYSSRVKAPSRPMVVASVVDRQRRYRSSPGPTGATGGCRAAAAASASRPPAGGWTANGAPAPTAAEDTKIPSEPATGPSRFTRPTRPTGDAIALPPSRRQVAPP
jgi:hypothetical protein